MGFWEPLIFWFLALGAVVTSIALLSFRNPLYSALALIVDFFCFAGLYALLSAHFLAITQVLVYAGAIMVLFVFIIMLLNLSDDELGARQFNLHHLLAGAAGLVIFGIAVGTFLSVIDGDQIARNREAASLSSHVTARASRVAYRVAEQRRREESPAAQRPDGRAPRTPTPIEPPEAPEVFVETPTRVPGLFADLSEPSLRREYHERLRNWREGTTTPATGEYRTYEPNRDFELPPAMRPNDDALEGSVEARDNRSLGELFGTVEPISILLVNRFVVPFELTAVLLLAAIFGAVVIAKKRL